MVGIKSPPSATTAIAAGKTIEETYQKKTELERILILLRPDMYIGSIKKHTQSFWVYEENCMVDRPISYVPGLYKIFDEILVNVADNKQRDPKMDSVKVVINAEENLISVYNNGYGVPVEIHEEQGVFGPELFYGHLLTNSGRNGYGAKLSNIFSTEFVIETADGRRKKKYKQVFSNNMRNKSHPVITTCKETENWTKVSFKPDLAKFNMTHLEDDVVALMKKRVVDIAGCLGKTVKVELNGQNVPVKSFTDYCDLYLNSASKNRPDTLPRITDKVNESWEVYVSLSEGQFQQVSFVNSIATFKGGTHVDHVTDQITSHIITSVSKKNKIANMKAHTVKNHLWVFVNALIENPTFDSQIKETLTLRQSNFGSKCELSQEFLKKVEELCAEKDKLEGADEELRKSTPRSLWAKDPEALEIQLNLQDCDEQTEEARKKIHGNAIRNDGQKPSNQPSKNPRKYAKKASTVEPNPKLAPMDISTESNEILEVAKPKGNQGPKKAPVREGKPALTTPNEEDDNDRLAAYNLDSSPDCYEAMDSVIDLATVQKKISNKRAAAAQKKPLSSVTDILDDDIADDDFEVEVEPAAANGKGRKRKAFAATTYTDNNRTYTATTVVGVLLNNRAILCGDGRLSKGDKTIGNQKLKLYTVKDNIFGGLCGTFRVAAWVVRNVREYIKEVKVQSTREIAEAFVYWANIKYESMLYDDRSELEEDEELEIEDEEMPDFILMGRLPNEIRPQLWKIFPKDAHKPKGQKALNKNFFSLPVCRGDPSGPYVAIAQTVCSIGSGSDAAMSHLQNTEADTGDLEHIKRIVMESFGRATKHDSATGGKLTMITLSDDDPPDFETVDPSHSDGRRVAYDYLESGGFVPFKYQEG